MKTSLIPYLNFNGQYQQAMTFYQQCLGGELSLQKISESPMAAQMPSEAVKNILHSTLTNNLMVLMGSDMIGSGLVPGNAINLCINCRSEEEINLFFSKLAVGGEVKEPLHQTFWGATFGKLKDKFGIQWMFNFTHD